MFYRPWEFRLPEYMVHDEHKPFGDDYDYMNDPEGLIYWKKGRVVPGMLFTFVMNEDVLKLVEKVLVVKKIKILIELKP